VKGLGYRQRAILGLLAPGREVPTGYLVRRLDCDPKVVNIALEGLGRRGLVRHVRHGVWTAA